MHRFKILSLIKGSNYSQDAIFYEIQRSLFTIFDRNRSITFRSNNRLRLSLSYRFLFWSEHRFNCALNAIARFGENGSGKRKRIVTCLLLSQTSSHRIVDVIRKGVWYLPRRLIYWNASDSYNQHSAVVDVAVKEANNCTGFWYVFSEVRNAALRSKQP